MAVRIRIQTRTRRRLRIAAAGLLIGDEQDIENVQ